jgi:hypothetical protein
MQCVVLGITPPNEDLVEGVRQNVTRIVVGRTIIGHQVQWDCPKDNNNDDDDVAQCEIHWRSDYTIALDVEALDDDTDSKQQKHQHGIPTLLMSVTFDGDTGVTPEDIVTSVQCYIGQGLYQVQVWATAGAPLPLRPMEGYEPHIFLLSHPTALKDGDWNGNYSELPKAVLAMETFGLVVQPHLFSMEIVSEFRHMVHEAIEQVEQRLVQYRPTIHLGTDVLSFREIASRNHHRYDLRLDTMDDHHVGSDSTPAVVVRVRQLVEELPYIKQFLLQAMHLDEVNEKNDDHERHGKGTPDTFQLLIDFDVSVVYSRPGAGTQGWHADGSHLAGSSDAGWNDHYRQLSPPYAICLFIPLIDLNESVGYTQFWPGSHAHEQLVGLGPFAQVTQSVWNSCGCQAGDGIWYDYRLMHQGMPHDRDATVSLRPILQIIFKQRWYVERANYGVKSLRSVSQG